MPPNRRHVSDERVNALIATGCGVKSHEDSKCHWPCFLFLINFIKCTSSYEAAKSTDDGEEYDPDTDAYVDKKPRRTKKLTPFAKVRGFGANLKQTLRAPKNRFWEQTEKDITGGSAFSKAVKEGEDIEDAAEGFLGDGVAAATAEIGAVGQIFRGHADLDETASDGAAELISTPVSPDPQVFCGGFADPAAQFITDDNNATCSATDPDYSFFKMKTQAKGNAPPSPSGSFWNYS